MLKHILAWKYLICVAAIFGCAIFISQQYQRAREQCAEKCEQVNPVAISPPSPAKDCEKCEQDAERHFPRWYRVFGWPEGITAWAILLTLLAIAEQTHETRRAASAAFGQMALSREKERARVIIEPTELAVYIDPSAKRQWCFRAVIKVENIGAGRAFEVDGRADIWVQDSGSPAKPPLYPLPWTITDYLGNFLDPGGCIVSTDSHLIPITVAQLVEGVTRAERATGMPRKAVYMEGFVQYESLGVRFRRDYRWQWLPGDCTGQMRGMIVNGQLIEGAWHEVEGKECNREYETKTN